MVSTLSAQLIRRLTRLLFMVVKTNIAIEADSARFHGRFPVVPLVTPHGHVYGYLGLRCTWGVYKVFSYFLAGILSVVEKNRKNSEKCAHSLLVLDSPIFSFI